MQCIHEQGAEEPVKCKAFADDYLECLHHRKLVRCCASEFYWRCSTGLLWQPHRCIICAIAHGTLQSVMLECCLLCMTNALWGTFSHGSVCNIGFAVTCKLVMYRGNDAACCIRTLTMTMLLDSLA
jgi:hypothetical protein